MSFGLTAKFSLGMSRKRLLPLRVRNAKASRLQIINSSILVSLLSHISILCKRLRNNLAVSLDSSVHEILPNFSYAGSAALISFRAERSPFYASRTYAPLSSLSEALKNGGAAETSRTAARPYFVVLQIASFLRGSKLESQLCCRQIAQLLASPRIASL